MIKIDAIFVGKPQQINDENGSWESAIFREPVSGPIMLHQYNLEGDEVADKRNHGSPAQAVCCHPASHYAYWNQRYPDAPRPFGPGAVGENWTLSGCDENDICVGDTYRVGEAVVQVSAPRYPCTKQERKVGVAGFYKAILETLRTGFYLQVVETGMVAAGDGWVLLNRPVPTITLRMIDTFTHHQYDAAFAEQLLATPELSPGYAEIVARIHKQKQRLP